MEANKTDGAFDRAWKVTCHKHNYKRLFFRECPECTADAKLGLIAESILSILAVTKDKTIIAEATKLVRLAKGLPV